VLSPEVRAFLDEKRFAVLATINRDGMPQQSVMWYDVIDGKIMMNTAAGRLKVGNLQRDPRVSLCVEDEYRFVTITGRAELDFDPESAQADIARLARRYHPAEKAENMIKDFQTQERISIWISIDRVLARGF
jgi:PPOX class probable F420-dependent enzyme